MISTTSPSVCCRILGIHILLELRRTPWPPTIPVPRLVPGPMREPGGLACAMASQRALVRRPSPRLAEGLVSHIERTSVDIGLAGRQWQQYVDALERSGWTCVEVPPADDCPDSVFVEDTMVVYRDLAVIARAGAGVRRPEAAAAELTVAAQGYRTVRIEAPGTLDGGDVLKIGSTVYAGLGGRTNQAGVDQLR